MSNREERHQTKFFPVTELLLQAGAGRTELRCPFRGCEMAGSTHVVEVKWETDPDERDRKRVLLEVRCEDGHGFIIEIKNHAGCSYLQGRLLFDVRSPFGEEQTW